MYNCTCLKVTYAYTVLCFKFFIILFIISSLRIIACGVPQGGVLSPTMFSIYINDIPIVVGQDEKVMLFADDIIYCLNFEYKSGNIISEEAYKKATEKAQEYLTCLEMWMDRWRLSLAPHK